MDKEIAGQPMWLWAVGAGVVILGYLYIKHQQSSAAPSGQGSGSGGAGKYHDTSSFKETITNLHGPPNPGHKRKKPGHG